MGRPRKRVSSRTVSKLQARLTEAEKLEQQQLKNERLKLQAEERQLRAELAKPAPRPAPVAKAPPPRVVVQVVDTTLNPYASAEPPAPGYFTSINPHDGHITRTPVPVSPVPQAPPPKPEPVTDGAPSIFKKYTRAQLAARHRREQCGSTAGGFMDDGGIVARNIWAESNQGRNFCKVAGVWPGGRRF